MSVNEEQKSSAEEVNSSLYIFQPAHNVPDEVRRLDEIHAGLTKYFGDRMSLAPLENTQPQKILELGSGSGAWAIQAAMQYPEADVIAVDLSPMPERPLPPNLRFQQLNLVEPFPFEKETFDIVHARLVLMHVPQGADVLRRTCSLVKPGGWLLVEEPDDGRMADGGKPLGPGCSQFITLWLNMLRSRGAEPCIGADLENIIRSEGSFSAIHVHKIVIPYSQKSQDVAENRLGLLWLTNARRVAQDVPARLREQGFTPDVVKKHLGELEDPSRDITTEMYVVWACKKLT